MDYFQFLTLTIDEGIKAAKKDYVRPNQKRKLEGSIAGFEACRGKIPSELWETLNASAVSVKTCIQDYTETEDEGGMGDYWWYRCYQLEVEWVCNVVSAMLMNQGMETIITPTCRGVLQADKILRMGGVADDS